MAKTQTTAQAQPIAFENVEAHGVELHPTETAPENAAIVKVVFLKGKTDDAKPKAKVKAMGDGREAVSNTWKNAVNALIKTLGFQPDAFDVQGEPTWPEASDDKPTSWDKTDHAAELKAAAPKAKAAFSAIEAGEGKVKQGTIELGRAIALAANTLSDPMFKAWLKDSSEHLFAFFERNKNAKAELSLVGNMPEEIILAMPERTIGAKAIQKRYYDNITEVVETAAEDLGKTVKFDMSKLTTTEAQKRLIADLRYWDESREPSESESDEGDKKTVRKHVPGQLEMERGAICAAHLALIDVEYEILAKDDEGNFVAAKDKDGVPVVPTLATKGKAKAANEVVAAFVKALNRAATRQEREAVREETEKAREVAEAIKPRVFADYSVKEAALHLATIVHVHDDADTIINTLGEMADAVMSGKAWQDVISDYRNAVDAEKAEQADAEAEADAEDDA